MRNRLFLILGLWAASSSVQASNKIIPHLVQTPEFGTWLRIVNLCSETVLYSIDGSMIAAGLFLEARRARQSQRSGR